MCKCTCVRTHARARTHTHTHLVANDGTHTRTHTHLVANDGHGLGELCARCLVVALLVQHAAVVHGGVGVVQWALVQLPLATWTQPYTANALSDI